jgi:hypothetical protein
MAGPFIFIVTNRLKKGKIDAERLRFDEVDQSRDP